MHGRNRASHLARLSNPSFAAALERKVESYAKLASAAKGRRLEFLRAGELDEELDPEEARSALDPEEARSTLELTATVLSINQDYYTMWSFRRDLLSALDRAHLAAGREAFPAASLAAELKLTAAALQKNPKSYPAFHHRKLAVDRALSLRPPPHPAAAALLQAEMGLTEALLAQDARNFHCVSYRRFLLAQALELPPELGAPQVRGQRRAGEVGGEERRRLLEGEMKFTGGLIEANFSNGSA